MKRIVVNRKDGVSRIIVMLAANQIDGLIPSIESIETLLQVKFLKYLRRGNELYEEV